MKRALIIPLIVLVLVTMACSLIPSAKPTETVAEPTKMVVEAAEATATEPAAPPPAEPTDTEAAPATAEPTDTQAPANTDTPAGPETYKDSFDRAGSSWSDPLIVTSQAAGHDPFVKVTSGDGKMRFAIEDKETYVYKFLTKEVKGATTIEVDFQNKGAINSSIALVCKANEDKTTWFEARVSASDNNFFLFLYDKARRTEQGKNPYLQLGKVHMKVEEYYPTKLNHVVFSCTDDALTLDVNKGKKQFTQPVDTKLDGTMMGLGVMSSNLTPATIDFDNLVIR